MLEKLWDRFGGEKAPTGELEVTLQVGGLLVSGKMISYAAFLERQGEQLNAIFLAMGSPDRADYARRTWASMSTKPDGPIVGEEINPIHLADVVILGAGPEPVRLPIWRLSLN